ncbi:acyltransferase family protein [Mycolicibacterium sp. PAM1]|uniref:acyltransferase family protein n=1 Tax=Mycolicibacterium sp. PAM1 TaxID=2853535 RepID=UPI0020CC0D98|nr:acyltransferase family protein [Mycolicibacterium sp. PAM1]
MAKRPDLQGMRAVAVLAVFADHLFGWPTGGFVGVDVFFVLSGFFITGLILKERASTGEMSFQTFYTRRVKRILPSALLVLTVTVIAAYALFPATRSRDTLLDALWAALFAANIRLESQGADYFQQDLQPSPIQHYWSLSIEEQFYFVWPLLLMLLFALTRKSYRRGRVWSRHLGLFLPMALIVSASFGWAMFLSAEDPNRAYFSTLTRVWELGVGALLAIAGPWLVRLPTAIRPVLAYVGLAGLIASLLLINGAVQFPAPWAALPVGATALVVASFHGAEVRGMFLLTNPVARWFGDTSYTLYLWHWPVIVLLLAMFPKGPLYYGVALAMALALTSITYYFFEDPIRKSNWLVDDPARTKHRRPKLSRTAWATVGIAAAIAVIVTIPSMAYSDKISAAKEEYTGAAGIEYETEDPFLGEEAAAPGIPSADPNAPSGRPAGQNIRNADSCIGAPAMRNANCKLRNPDAPLQPSIDEFTNDLPRSRGCFGDGERGMRTCKFGYGGPDATRIVLVGDSHAYALLPAFWQILDVNKWNLTVYSGTGCDLMDPPEDECAEPMGKIRADLLDHPYDLVISTSARAETPPVRFAKAWEPLAAAGSRIAVVADNPDNRDEALACLTRISLGGDKSGECNTPRAYGFRVADPQVAAAKVVPGTTTIDLSDYYCNAVICPTVIGDVIVYRDNGHITATFAKTLAGPLEEGIKRALSVPKP